MVVHSVPTVIHPEHVLPKTQSFSEELLKLNDLGVSFSRYLYGY